MKRAVFFMVVLLLCITAVGWLWAQDKAAGGKKQIVVGISVKDLGLERWKRDLNYMLARANKLGIKTYNTSAKGDAKLQISQIENMLTRGIDVLICIPQNGKIVGSVVEACHKDGVKVIAYDHLLEDCNVDYYITFNMRGVGELQAKYLLDRVPTGSYYLLAGPKDDNNARLFREGQMLVLQRHIDSGGVKVAGDQWAEGWLSEKAMKLTENVLTANNNQIDVILASNDSTANGAIQALMEQGLAGKVLVTGQDCDLAACQRIVAGTQTMSVYKPLPVLASAAIDLAFNLATGKPVTTNNTYFNGKIDVLSIDLPIVAVDKTNIMDTVIADGFHKMEDVYKNIPKSQWPKKSK